jgi:hypothetical protein
MKKTCYDITERFRIFQIHFVPCGNVVGARIRIRDMRRNKTKYIPYSHEYRDAQDEALNYLEKIGIPVDAIGLANKDRDCVFLSKNITTDLV